MLLLSLGRTDIQLYGDPATILNFGQNSLNHSRNGTLKKRSRSAIVVVEVQRNLRDRRLTAVVLTLLKIYVATSPWTRSAAEA